MTMIQMNLAPIPESIQDDVAGNISKHFRKKRDTIPPMFMDEVKTHLQNQLLSGKNYATVFAEFEDCDLCNRPGHEFVVSYKYLSLILADISKTFCKINCYDHRVFLIDRYFKKGFNKSEIARKVGMTRAAVYAVFSKKKKSKVKRKRPVKKS